MDSGTTIIGIVILILCVVPIVMAHTNNKRKKEKLVRSLSGYAELNGCSITEYDLWMETIIGIDSNKGCLFFMRNAKGFQYQQDVNLSSVKSCYIKGDGKPEAIEKLELVFVLKDKGDVVFEFYNAEVSMQVNEELQLIRKWEAIVASYLGKGQ